VSSRLVVRRTATAAAAVAVVALARPAAAQPYPFNGLATQYTFSGCTTHRCTTLLLLTQPTARANDHGPGGAVQVFDWRATHTFLPAADGQGVLWFHSESVVTYVFPGAAGNVYFDMDVQAIGHGCYANYWDAQNAGACVDDGPHTAWLFVPYTPTTVSLRYSLLPAGGSVLVPGGFQALAPETLTLRLDAVAPITTPEPATLALVTGGLVVVAGGAVRRRRA
jgi:hypothetical protein